MNKVIKLNTTLARAALLAVGLLCVTAVYFAVKWYLANTLATNTEYKDVAEYAVNLAPDDPKAHYVLASIRDQSFMADDLPKALAEYETAVSLAPDDFRLWFDLGRARERAGDSAGAEKALRKALELAPNYSRIHWTLGNLLLREGNTEEAFLEIRKAVENDSNYANPAVTTLWQFFDGDVSLISQKIGASSQIKSALAVFLAKQNRFDEAFALWNEIPETERKTIYLAESREILQSLLAAKRYRDAVSIQTQIAAPDAEKIEIGKFSNGGFESNVAAANDDAFGWKIGDGLQPQIGFDDQQRHGGNRSLVILFNSPAGRDFRSVQQTIPVEGGKHYIFETFARSDLKSPATVKWEIVDAANDKVLAATAAVPNSSGWQPLTAEFTTAPDAQAVTARLARVACPTTLCPIEGKVWFDDFNLR
ncbi:MAG: tetratricopeptide repeat protein [Pyrinomonadaceae bacterium]